ncbi:hypothetical protein MKX01_015148 [Papaver californicum]|nr:hypothetical protein MKX01_015148 [Papaver californicum]
MIGLLFVAESGRMTSSIAAVAGSSNRNASKPMVTTETSNNHYKYIDCYSKKS